MKLCILMVDILKMCIWVLTELELILKELQLFELCDFWQVFIIVGSAVSVINSSYSFQWMFLRLCKHIVDIFM